MILDAIKWVHLVSEECKENGDVRGDPKDGNAAVENHKNILMDQGKPEKYTNMQKFPNTWKPQLEKPWKACNSTKNKKFTERSVSWGTATEEEKEKFSNFPAERFACQESFQFVNFNTWWQNSKIYKI